MKLLKIQSEVEMIDKVMVFDISGRVNSRKQKHSKYRGHTFRFKPIRAGFIVKIFLHSGETLSKKNYLLETKK
jgi:hypothetical protein